MPPISYGLILANDITQPERAIKISKDVAPYVDGIKIGITTVLDIGTPVIKKIKSVYKSKLVIADFKVADIGFWDKEGKIWDGTNKKIVENAVSAGADYVICHSINGISSIQECIEVAHSMGGKVLTLPYMTHVGAELFFGHPLDIEYVAKVFERANVSISREKLTRCKTISDAILVLGDYLKVDGFIGPANNWELLKRYREFTSKEIFAPGIGRQAVGNQTVPEQIRGFFKICGERSAIIVGSAIYKSPNPQGAALEFAKLRDEAAH